ncbi:MAG: sensor histidine kinase [Clostridia bacterium]|nr:sensor histidine kinase [Clostridia bacterium]
MQKIWVDILLYILEAAVFIVYCESAFESNVNRKLRIALCFSAYAILFGIYQIGVVYINGIAIVLLSFLLIHCIYGVKTLSALLQSVLILAFIVAGEYLVFPITNIIYKTTDAHNDIHSYVFVVVVSKIIYFICLMVMLFIYKKRQADVSGYHKGFALVIMIPISNVVLLTYVEYVSTKIGYDVKANIMWGIIAFLMLVSNFLVFYNRFYIIKQSKKMNDLNLQNQKREFDEQYYALVKKSNEEMQILSHDFKNHLIQLDTAENMEQVHEYIKTMYPTIQQFHSVNVSDNKTLNTIISKYNSLCAVKGIEFKYEISASLSFLENNDLTAILGNLLDNAIESAEKCAEKRIALSIYSKNEKTTVLRVTNTCESAPVVKNGKLQTTKADDAPHGLGLKSVESTVKKYGGFYEWEYSVENEEFETLISFYH